MTNRELITAAMILNGITEESHTYAHWKALGYQVRKGEHAAFQTMIWKAAPRKKADDANEEEGAGVSMFMKRASFFTRSQVDPISPRKEQERQAGITSAILAATLPA